MCTLFVRIWLTGVDSANEEENPSKKSSSGARILFNYHTFPIQFKSTGFPDEISDDIKDLESHTFFTGLLCRICISGNFPFRKLVQ